jgi:hypothetical protein
MDFVTTNSERSLPEKQWTPAELRSVIARAEQLIGKDLDDLVRRVNKGRMSPTPPKHEHKFIESLLLLRRASDEPNNAVLQDPASIAVVDVDGILHVFEDWSPDPAWPEFQRAMSDPRQFLHAVTTLIVASSLKDHHPAVRLVASSTPGRSPDLAVDVTDKRELSIEVKTSPELAINTLSQFDALKFVTKALKAVGTGSGSQVAAGKPALLVIGGLHMDDTNFERLTEASEYVLAHKLGSKSHLLGIVVTKLFYKVGLAHGHVEVVLSQESRVRRNSAYAGDLKLEGDWSGDWHLVPA